MNANEYNYGTDPDTGLPRKLVRYSVNIQEEVQSELREDPPKIGVFLREITIAPTGNIATNKSAWYEVVKGQISYDVDGDPLLKYELSLVNGEVVKTPVYYPGTTDPMPRDNGYENIILLFSWPVPSDAILDDGIKEYYKIS